MRALQSRSWQNVSRKVGIEFVAAENYRNYLDLGRLDAFVLVPFPHPGVQRLLVILVLCLNSVLTPGAALWCPEPALDW